MCVTGKSAQYQSDFIQNLVRFASFQMAVNGISFFVHFYILSETRMLRNHYFSFFFVRPKVVVDSWRRLSIGF